MASVPPHDPVAVHAEHGVHETSAAIATVCAVIEDGHVLDGARKQSANPLGAAHAVQLDKPHTRPAVLATTPSTDTEPVHAPASSENGPTLILLGTTLPLPRLQPPSRTTGLLDAVVQLSPSL